MLVWATLIVGLTVIGFVTLLVGMVIVAPLLGYATWQAYRDLIASPSGHQAAARREAVRVLRCERELAERAGFRPSSSPHERVPRAGLLLLLAP
jgi:hypothetical protein